MRSGLERRKAQARPSAPAPRYDRFVAIDFETADSGPDSACAVGLVRVEEGRIVRREHRFIRPPRKSFMFTYIHGITWERVSREAPFGEVWEGLKEMIADVPVLAAHNSRFDERVLRAGCVSAGIEAPEQRFVCTVQIARKTWGIYPTNLPSVCSRLGIDLNHHEALSDAEACAQIVIRASNFSEARP